MPYTGVKSVRPRSAKPAAIPRCLYSRTACTTVGWVDVLKSLVRHCAHHDIDFTSLETTSVPYGGRGAFLRQRRLILDRKDRILTLLTDGGLTDVTDVTLRQCGMSSCCCPCLASTSSMFVRSSSLPWLFCSRTSIERLFLPDIQASVTSFVRTRCAMGSSTDLHTLPPLSRPASPSIFSPDPFLLRP